MMFLHFVVGKDSYVLDVAQIVEVVPYVTLKNIPRAPGYVAGLLNYRGKSVPVIDLTALMTGRVSRSWLSSRIILVNFHGENEGPPIFALLAERVSTTIKFPESDFYPAGVDAGDTEFLGDVAIYQGNIIQRINIGKLLPVQVYRALFPSGDEIGSVASDSEGYVSDGGDRSPA